MRLLTASILSCLSLAACGAHQLSSADRASVFGALGLSPTPQGQVLNECGELATPQLLTVELGGEVGTAVLFAISGGAGMAACYGDGPNLHLLAREESGWREIYAARGRMLIILPTSTRGVHDIGDGGPGFSFPVWAWDGTQYAPADRDVSDAELSRMNATYLP